MYDSEIILYDNILDDARNCKETEKEGQVEIKINSIAKDIVEIKDYINKSGKLYDDLQSTVVEIYNDIKSTENMMKQSECDNKK